MESNYNSVTGVSWVSILNKTIKTMLNLAEQSTIHLTINLRIKTNAQIITLHLLIIMYGRFKRPDSNLLTSFQTIRFLTPPIITRLTKRSISDIHRSTLKQWISKVHFSSLWKQLKTCKWLKSSISWSISKPYINKSSKHPRCWNLSLLNFNPKSLWISRTILASTLLQLRHSMKSSFLKLIFRT